MYFSSGLVEINENSQPLPGVLNQRLTFVAKLNSGILRHGIDNWIIRIYGSDSSCHPAFFNQGLPLHDFQSICFRHSSARHTVLAAVPTAQATGWRSDSHEHTTAAFDCQFVKASAVWLLMASSCRQSPWESLDWEVQRLL